MKFAKPTDATAKQLALATKFAFVLNLVALLAPPVCADEQTLVIGGAPANPLRKTVAAPTTDGAKVELPAPQANLTPAPSNPDKSVNDTATGETVVDKKLETTPSPKSTTLTPQSTIQAEADAAVTSVPNLVKTIVTPPSQQPAKTSQKVLRRPVALNEDTDNPAFVSDDLVENHADDELMEAPLLMAEAIDADSINALIMVDDQSSMDSLPSDIDAPNAHTPTDTASNGTDSLSPTDGQFDEPLDSPYSDQDLADMGEGEVASESIGEESQNSDSAKIASSRPVMRRPIPIVIEPIPTEGLTSSDSPSSSDSEKRMVSLRRGEILAPGSKLLPINQIDDDYAQPSSIDPEMALRAKRVEATLQYYIDNPESIAVRSPWAVMHALLPFGVETEVVAGNRRVNAIAWMCANQVCRTQRIFTPVRNSFRPNVGGGVQGHDGQFLAMLAQSRVPSSYPIRIGNRSFTVANLVQYEMLTCRPKSELTFKLIGLSYYLGTKQSWRSNDGQTWNVERLLREEMAQPVNGAACGGTHRLMGISFALNQRRQEAMPLEGSYAAGVRYIDDYVNYAWSLQNTDGSFSTNWFESRGSEPKDDRKVQTTGHILEWLVYTSSPEELRNPRVERAVDYLVSQVYDRRDVKWAIGPRGHALRSLVLYRQKVFLDQESESSPTAVAETPTSQVNTKKR